ncbi:MAG: AtpZ/AtpI family protein [Phycisphaerae bacterium]|nr:AtpZ/AtpI family protein [Phycisphaerae bacterium]
MKKTTKKTDEKNEDRQSMRWLGYGVEFIGVLGIFTYMGYMADEKFKTTPWLMLTGLLVSFIGMIYLLIKETKDWQ